MTNIALLTFAFSLSLCLGMNSYLSILTLIIIAKNGFLTALPEPLWFINQEIFIVMIAGLAIVHFFVDMTPGVDTAWDLFHTVIRIPIATLLTVAVFEHHTEIWQVCAFFIGLSSGVVTHFGKSCLRANLNGKTYVLYNWLASITETVLIITTLVLAMHYPLSALIVALPILIIAIGLIRRYWRDFHHSAISIIKWLRQRKGWREEDRFFD